MLDNGSKYPSPATSSNNGRLPTTKDVHLYADPKTYNTQTPVLYADCEGLNSGWAVTSETKKRDDAVMRLYPRVLYTFSDVVVFVLRNPRYVSRQHL